MSKTYISASIRRIVFDRAQGKCEYCLLPESLSISAHHVDHIIAEKHNGKTEPENLALSCSICNYAKGSDIASINPETDELIRLYHPRRDRWSDHFRLEPESGTIQPLTAIAQVTVHLLQLNQPKRITERKLWIQAGVMK
jgi:5-methylcytosine-specific restriction endonuclease McrA